MKSNFSFPKRYSFSKAAAKLSSLIITFSSVLLLATSCVSQTSRNNHFNEYLKKCERVGFISDSLFLPIEFSGKVAKSYETICGGPRAYCQRIIFKRSDWQDVKNEPYPIIDRGNFRLLTPDSNIVILSSWLGSKHLDNNFSGPMPVDENDLIIKKVDEDFIRIVSRFHNRTFKIKLLTSIKGDITENIRWLDQFLEEYGS